MSLGRTYVRFRRHADVGLCSSRKSAGRRHCRWCPSPRGMVTDFFASVVALGLSFFSGVRCTRLDDYVTFSLVVQSDKMCAQTSRWTNAHSVHGSKCDNRMSQTWDMADDHMFNLFWGMYDCLQADVVGEPVRMANCAETSLQKWTLTPSGQLTTGGLCLDWDSVSMQKCDEAKNQRFVMEATCQKLKSKTNEEVHAQCPECPKQVQPECPKPTCPEPACPKPTCPEPACPKPTCPEPA